MKRSEWLNYNDFSICTIIRKTERMILLNLISKKKGTFTLFIIYGFTFLGNSFTIQDNFVYAMPTISDATISSDYEEIEQQENSSVLLAKTALRITKNKYPEEEKKTEEQILLCGQPFYFKKDELKGFVVSADENLTVLDDWTVYSAKCGVYNMEVFYNEIGLVKYSFIIREPEFDDDVYLELPVNDSSNLSLENYDLAVYESYDENIVEVSSDGRVHAISNGEATVTATINRFQEVRFHITAIQAYRNYTKDEFDLICAIVQQECATSYDGALAVISCAYNRSLTPRYAVRGADPLSQLMLEGQFCYSLDENWKRYLGGNVNDNVKNAVYDCLYYGKTNHDFLSFRGFEVDGAVNFDGNYYFNE